MTEWLWGQARCLRFHVNLPPYLLNGWVLTYMFLFSLQRGGNGARETGSCLPKVSQLVENSNLLPSSSRLPAQTLTLRSTQLILPAHVSPLPRPAQSYLLWEVIVKSIPLQPPL